MQRERLTLERIRTFTCPPDVKQAFLGDTVAPRLAVRATASAKSFIFEAKLNRSTIRTTIGDVRTWYLDDARQEARRLGMLIDKGIDPRQEKQERIAATEAKREEARRQDVTVAEAWGAYIEARKAKWSERTLYDHIAVSREGGEARKRGPGTIEPGPLAALMPLKLSDLTPDRVSAWLEQENTRRPTRAALAYRLLRAFIRWASGMPEYQAAAHVEAVGSRVARDHLHRVKAKDGDSLQREQLPSWFAAVRKLSNPVQAAYLQALLLTGTRREELAGLRWEDVDFQWKSMAIADKVEETGRIIPLTSFVAALLASLPRRSEWVFSSPTAASGRIQEPRIAHNRALAIAGLPHLSLHGLRRSFGTLAEWTETPVGVVAQIMGHKPSAIAEKHYRRRPLDLLRMWHERIEAWILEQAGIQQPEEGASGLRLVKH
ncbi:MAG: integrase family protein [Pseudomonadota bacterium]|nr:integrase family protein [Pseudomonadota bacterium]